MDRQSDDRILDVRMENDITSSSSEETAQKSFSGGADINMLNEVDPTFKYYLCLHANEMLDRWSTLQAGHRGSERPHRWRRIEIAMAATSGSLRRTGQIGLPEVGLVLRERAELSADALHRQAKAMELTGTGRTMDFDEAKEPGSSSTSSRRTLSRTTSWPMPKQFFPPNKASKAGRRSRPLPTVAHGSFSGRPAIQREPQQQLFQV